MIDKKELPDMVYALLEKVGLTPAKATAAKYPHQLSGGQRQRVNIARNLAVEAEVVLADEPTSMLDVSIRIGILNLMEQMKNELGVSMLYITHDIATARYVAEDLAVMYVGHMVEWGEVDEILHHPQHPYTQLLISAVPDPEKSIHAELEGGRKGRSRSGRRSPAVAPLPGAAIRQCHAARRRCPHHQACRQPLRALLPLRVRVSLDRPDNPVRPCLDMGRPQPRDVPHRPAVNHRSNTLMELLINQVGYECDGHKVALLQTSPAPDLGGYVRLQRLDDGQILFETPLQPAGSVPGWQGRAYWRADFSAFKEPGHYRLEAITAQGIVRSTRFAIGQDLLASRCLSDVIHYLKGQRASGTFDRADRSARLLAPTSTKMCTAAGSMPAAT